MFSMSVVGMTRSNRVVFVSATSSARQPAASSCPVRARATSGSKATSPVELKKKIDSGTYAVDPGQIADGMLREAIMEELANNPA